MELTETPMAPTKVLAIQVMKRPTLEPVKMTELEAISDDSSNN